MSNKIEIKNGTSVSVVAPQQSTTSISVPERGITNVSIDGVKSVGITDSRYTHEQATASNVWNISHNLNKKPSVTIVDSGDNVVIGEVQYIDNNNITVSFSATFSGNAYLN